MSGLTIGSLFSGVGGLELGLEWGLGGAETRWQVEYEEHARLILGQHWPEAQRHEDVRHVGRNNLSPVDVICGGFPCQPHSVAGQRKASADERDLWGEFARIIGELRPGWVVAENVPGLLSSRDPAFRRDHPGGFFGRVLRDLAEMGFDAEWGCFPASAIGAHHKRDRVFIVAYSQRLRCPAATQREGHAQSTGIGQNDQPWNAGENAAALAHANGSGWGEAQQNIRGRERHALGQGASLADAYRLRESQPEGGQSDERGRAGNGGRETAADVAHASSAGREEQHAPTLAARAEQHTGGRDAPSWAGGDWQQPHPLAWRAEPGVRGMADGLALRVDRLTRLGNGVVPQQAAVIGRAIKEAEECRRLTGNLPERLIRPEHFGGVA